MSEEGFEEQASLRGVHVFLVADERQRLLKAGFQEHVVKPVDPWELCRRVASLATRDP